MLITAIRYHRDSFHHRVPRLPVVLCIGSLHFAFVAQLFRQLIVDLWCVWVSLLSLRFLIISLLYRAMNIHTSRRLCWLLPATAVFAIAVTSTSVRGDDDGLLRWVMVTTGVGERGRGPYPKGICLLFIHVYCENGFFPRKKKNRNIWSNGFRSNFFNLIFYATKYKIPFRFYLIIILFPHLWP